MGAVRAVDAGRAAMGGGDMARVATSLVVIAVMIAAGCSAGEPSNGDDADATASGRVAGAVAVLTSIGNTGVAHVSRTNVLGHGPAPQAIAAASSPRPMACPNVSFPDGLAANPFRVLVDFGSGCKPGGASPVVSGRITFSVSWGGSSVGISASFADVTVGSATLNGSVAASATPTAVSYSINGDVTLAGVTYTVSAALTGSWNAGSQAVVGDETFTLRGSGTFSSTLTNDGTFTISNPLQFSATCLTLPDSGVVDLTWSTHTASVDFNTGNCSTASVTIDGRGPTIVTIL